MVDSPQFKKNPLLHAFLPMFYLVWTDAVLTPGEIKHIQKHVNKQTWLTAEERSFLLGNLDPKSPPSPRELKQWKNQIQQSAANFSAEDKKGIANTSLKLARLYGAMNDTMQEMEGAFREIETALGVVGEEAFHFKKASATVIENLKTEAGFDTGSMQAILDGNQGETIRKLKVLLSDPEFAYYTVENLQDYREKVLHWCRILASHGFGALAYPRQYGGKEDMKSYFTVMETLSYHDLSMVIKFGVQFGLWGMSVFFLGTKKHHDKYLEKIGTLELPGCFAMTETGHGSNVKGIETTANYDHVTQTFVINTPNENARKEFIGNAACHGRMATVFAKLIVEEVDYGVAAFVVRLRDDKGKLEEGVRIIDCGRKMGLNGVDNGIIYFDKVTIPVENLLDRFTQINEEGQFESHIASDNRRFFTMLGTLVGGRIGIPRAGLSASKSGLTIAIRYADGRKQFGPEDKTEVPILNYRTHQRRLMPLLSNVYALHFSLGYLTQRFINRSEKDIMEIEALAAGLKAFTTWNTTKTLQECREACGGKGYLSENRLDSLKNDTDVFTTFEGDNTVLMQLVAKSRLTDFKQEFSNIDFFGIVNYVGEQAKTAIMEMNPIIIRKTDIAHLLDPDFHLSAFRYRERDILTSAAKRLKKHLSNGMDSFDAFNQTQFHLLNVGQAFIERIVLEQFQLSIEKTKDVACKASLHTLCALFALTQIEKNKGWYLEHGYMEGVKTKAIRKLVNELCWEVRQVAVPLVDAFNIPDSCLGAPIGLKD